MGGHQRSHPADARYRPLGGIEPWATAPVDADAWAGAVDRWSRLRAEAPAWGDLVARGAVLAAAHSSAAVAGQVDGDRGAAPALLSGASPSTLPDDDAAHVRAGASALAEALAGDMSEATVRRVHAVACAPQVTAALDGGADHVLGHGDYKHHPNHEPTAQGWRAAAPVDDVAAEAAQLARLLAGSADELHPLARAALALHALHHVRPFADGNGRVARALAGAVLVSAGGLPLLVPADGAGRYAGALAAAEEGDAAALVRFVAQRAAALAETVHGLVAAGEASRDDGPLAAWQQRADAAAALGALLPPAAERALGRHRARRDLGWMSPLADTAVVLAPPVPTTFRSDRPVVVLRSDGPAHPVVAETLSIEAHPLTRDDAMVLRAALAELSLEVGPGAVLGGGDLAPVLDGWLDRVVRSLSVAVAAASE